MITCIVTAPTPSSTGSVAADWQIQFAVPKIRLMLAACLLLVLPAIRTAAADLPAGSSSPALPAPRFSGPGARVRLTQLERGSLTVLWSLVWQHLAA